MRLRLLSHQLLSSEILKEALLSVLQAFGATSAEQAIEIRQFQLFFELRFEFDWKSALEQGVVLSNQVEALILLQIDEIFLSSKSNFSHHFSIYLYSSSRNQAASNISLLCQRVADNYPHLRLHDERSDTRSSVGLLQTNQKERDRCREIKEKIFLKLLRVKPPLKRSYFDRMVCITIPGESGLTIIKYFPFHLVMFLTTV